MKKIYTIMLTCNQKEETLRCLGKLVKVNFDGYQSKIILVDNASYDGTSQAIKKHFSQVKLIINKQNRGFAAAVNQGLKLALEDKEMEFVLQLNNDTFLNKNFVNQLLKTAKSDNAIGVVAPALKHFQKDKLFYGMEGYLDLARGTSHHRNTEAIKEKKIINAQFVSGCCMLIKREVLEKAGLLDEKFYLYLDDLDYCLTVQKAGFKTVLDPQAQIGHKVSAYFKNPLTKLPHSFRSNIIFVLKWTPFWYKPLAILRCLYFYPSLAIIWSLPIIKREITNKLHTLSAKFGLDLNYFVKGGFWLTLEQLFINLTSLLMAIIFAKFLTKEAYGNYNYIFSILGILALFSLPGIDTAIRNAVARGFEGSFLTAFKTKIKYSLLGSLGCLFLFGYYFWQKNITLSWLFLLIVPFFPFIFSSYLYVAFLKGKKLFKKATFYEIFYQVLNFSLVALIVIFTKNLFLLLIGYLVFTSFTRSYFFKKTLEISLKAKNYDPKTLSYGKHLSLAMVIETIAGYFDRLLVFNFLGPVNLAIYSFAILPVDKINGFFDSLQPLVMPKLAEKSLGEINKKIMKGLVDFLVLGIGLAVFYYLISPVVFKFLFPNYLASLSFSRLYVLIIIFRVPALLLSSLGTAKITLFPKKIIYLNTLMPQLIFILTLIYTGKNFGLVGIIWTKILFSLLVILVGLANWLFLKKTNPAKTI